LSQLEEYTFSDDLKYYANFETYVVPCFHSIRSVTVQTIEKIAEWRRLLWMNPPYQRKEGKSKNYLIEITKDVSKVISKTDLQVFKRLNIFLNDFVFFIPKEGNEVLSDLKGLLKDNKGLELAEVQFFDTICKNLQLKNEEEQGALHHALVNLVSEDKIYKDYKVKLR